LSGHLAELDAPLVERIDARRTRSRPGHPSRSARN
jgi:hypothetical protein